MPKYIMRFRAKFVELNQPRESKIYGHDVFRWRSDTVIETHEHKGDFREF